MKIRMVVLDMAGTTIADDNAVFSAFNKALEKHGVFVPDEAINPLMGYKKPEAIRRLVEQYTNNYNARLVEEIHDYFVDEMLHFYRESPHVHAIPGVEQVLHWLKSKGMYLALNTGFSRQIADVIIKRVGWMEMGIIDDYIASDEVESGRPNPAMIHTLMQRAGFGNPSEVVKVGDTEVDINEGRNAGCGLVVAVTTGAFTKEQLSPYNPDHIIDNLHELQNILQTRV